MKHDFERYDASIKDIPCHSLYLQILKCLSRCLERLKSGMVMTPSHHYPTMKHTWIFFVTSEIESIAHTSHQMVLSSHTMVYISLPKAFEFAFFFILLLKRVMWRLAREKYEGILALHILLSQTMDLRRKMSYNQIKMCMCVENLWWLT